MKKVRPLQTQPPLLAAYVAANTAATQATGTQAGKAWEAFRTDDRSAFTELLAELAAVQRGLCLYCEQRVTLSTGFLVPLDYQVEHVLPKSKGPGRVLQWGNLALACQGGTSSAHKDPSRFTAPPSANTSCGSKKDADDLPPCGDPRAFASFARLTKVDTLGIISADVNECIAAGVNVAVINDTIALLNLNCERLKLARGRVAAELNEWLLQILDVLMNDPHVTAADRQNTLAGFVSTRLQPDVNGHLRAFWSVWREKLGPAAQVWVATNASLL